MCSMMDIMECGEGESFSRINVARADHVVKCIQNVYKLEKKLDQLETWMRRNLGYVTLDGGFDNFIFPSPPSPVKSLHKIPTVIIKTEIVLDDEDEKVEEILLDESDGVQASVDTSSNIRDAIESSSNCMSTPNQQQIPCTNQARVINSNITNKISAPIATATNESQSQPQPVECQPSVSWRQSPFRNSQTTAPHQFNQSTNVTLNKCHNQNPQVNSPVENENVPPTALSQNATTSFSTITSKTLASGIHPRNGMILMHPCKSCRRIFPSLPLLQKHVLFFHKKWKCKFCKKAFDQRISLEQHVKDGHSHRPGMYQKEKTLAYMTERYKQQQQQQQQGQTQSTLSATTVQHESLSQSHPQQPQMYSQTHVTPNPNPNPHPHPNQNQNTSTNPRSHHLLQQQQQQQQQQQSCGGTVNKSQQHQHQQPPGPHFPTTTSVSSTSASTSTSTSMSTSTSNPYGNRGAILIPVSTGSILSQQQKKGNGKANNRTRFEISNQTSQPNPCPCRVCGKVFSVAEHLAQHMRSHPSHPRAPQPS